MKRLFILLLLLITLVTMPSVVFAQGMMGWTTSSSGTVDSSQTAKEETEGKAIWDKLLSKQLGCKNLTDDDFDVLGEYFMGQSIADSQRHALMNRTMVGMMGEQGEKQMHIAMGKRFSGCDTSAPYLQNGTRFLPMMWMMGGENSMMGWYGGWGNMMRDGGFGLWGLTTWVLVTVVLVLLIVYLWKQIQKR